jgi:hypothetical protein
MAPRHCEERSDEAIHLARGKMDCFASLAMTPRAQLPILILDERRKGGDILLQHFLHGFLG